MALGILGERSLAQEELVTRVRWYIKIRWFYLLVLAGGGVIGEYIAFGLSGLVVRDILIVAASILANGLFYVLAQHKTESMRHFTWLAFSQIILDIGTASYLVLTHGGFQSRMVILYVIPIIIASVLFGRIAIYFTTFLSVLAYNAILLFDRHQRNLLDAADVETAIATENFYVVMLFYTLVIVLMAYIASFLSGRVKSYEEELAKEEVVALTSHQLRTPATAVKNLLSVLLDNYVGTITAEQRALLRKAYDENERELSLVESMLDAAQPEKATVQFDPEPTDVRGLIHRTVEVQKGTLDSRAQKVQIKIKGEKLEWMLDSQKMYMILDNLLSNASKYSPPESTIKIQAEVRGRSNPKLEIKVKDEGVGIHKEDMERIFQKRVRVKNRSTMAVSGSGLGLYLTKRMVDLHRGIINVNSEPQKGTEFVILIPKIKGETNV